MEQMPTETDLRRTIAAIMSTRSEQILTFVADDGLSFHEVASVLSHLKEDDPELEIALSTSGQMGSAGAGGWGRAGGLCLSTRDDWAARLSSH